MKRCEASEQILLMQWCELNKNKYKGIDLIFAIPNGGTRHPREAANLKRQGVKAGVPDMFLPIANKKHNGLFIELKYGKNKATEKQIEWLSKLNKQGYKALVCNGFEEAKKAIEDYISA